MISYATVWLRTDLDPENDENSIITSLEELSKLARLMGVDEDDVSKALTIRTMVARNETYKVPLNKSSAEDSCDAFAKEIYSQSFDWLVRTINSATCAEDNYIVEKNEKAPSKFSMIGLLDIFGFESFKVNRFEQLCINYANEKLQQKFTIDIFRSVQAEYEYEGIELGDIQFEDNAGMVNLMQFLSVPMYAVTNLRFWALFWHMLNSFTNFSRPGVLDLVEGRMG